MTNTYEVLTASSDETLWEAWEQDTPEVGGAYILETIGTIAAKFTDLFKNHTAWNSMIIGGETKGSYRLNEPKVT